VHVHHAERVFLLVVPWRQHQAPVQSDQHRESGESTEPRRPARERIDMRR
jgi:hypothetical protein